MLDLAEKARAGQWSPDDAIDWAQRSTRPAWLPRAVYGRVISQILQGEWATIQFCQDLRRMLPDGAVRRCVSYQIADERRHALVLERYLACQRMPVTPSYALSQMHEKILLSNRPIVAKMIAYNAVLEGEAISLLEGLSTVFDCPVFRQIMRRLAVDEARHLAFGKNFLSENLETLSFEEKRDLYIWVKSLWFEGAAAALQELSGLAGWVTRKRGFDLEKRWARQTMVLRQIGLLREGAAGGRSCLCSDTGCR